MADQDTNNTKSLADRAKQILATAVGGGVGAYAGLSILIPLFGTFLVGYGAKKLVPEERQFIVPAFAVQSGHVLWFIAGMMLAGVVTNLVVIDVVLLSAGLLWFVLAPGFIPISLLATFQLLSLWINVETILPLEWGSPTHKALVAHIALRIFALFLLGQATYVLLSKRRAADIDGPP